MLIFLFFYTLALKFDFAVLRLRKKLQPAVIHSRPPNGSYRVAALHGNVTVLEDYGAHGLEIKTSCPILHQAALPDDRVTVSSDRVCITSPRFQMLAKTA